MEDFVTAYNNKSSAFEPYSKPFVGTPKKLSPAQQAELLYSYKYLEAPIEKLAEYYALTPLALSEWLELKGAERLNFDDNKALQTFEEEVNQTYKKVRIQLAGLTSLHTAVAWEQLALAELDLLASLRSLAEDLKARGSSVEPIELHRATKTLSELTNRHSLLNKALDKPYQKDIEEAADSLTKSIEEYLDDIDGTSYKLPQEKDE